MVRYGTAPFLECSTRGERRLSPFFARVRGERSSIEEMYQATKIYDDGTTGLSPERAREHQRNGHRITNIAQCQALFIRLWDRYMEENPHLVALITSVSGLSDIFGSYEGSCQATELWRIRCAALGIEPDFTAARNDRSSSPRQMSLF